MKRCAVLLSLCLFSASLFGQSTNATISGGVADPAGKLIPDAEVSIQNDATGVVYASKTNGSGMYLVPVLPPGHYHIQVTKPGFKTIIKADVVLNVQSAVSLNFVLPVGAASESVTVEAGSSTMNTNDATVSTVIDRKFVENMPLNGRSFQDLISLTPGVVTQSPQGQAGSGIQKTGDFSVNGQRSESNYYTVDGVSANIGAGNGVGTFTSGMSGTLPGSTALGTTQSIIPLDALQEFRVLSSTYSAEFGRSPGGQFTFATRSGTDQLHGSAYDYLRNSYFDANDWFNKHSGLPIASLRQNDFGGAVGGRVLLPHVYDGKEHTFFFFAYEGLRLTQPQAATIQYVPDSFMRAQAVPSMRPILNAFPLPTVGAVDYGTAASPSLAQFIKTYSSPSKIDSTSARLDHVVNARHSVFFRFGDTPSSTLSRTLSTVTTSSINTRTYTGGLTSQLTRSITNDFRIGYARAETVSSASLDDFGGATPADLNSLVTTGSYPGIEPFIYVYISGIGASSLQSYAKAGNQSRQWNVVDTAGALWAHHLFRFGIDYRRIASPTMPLSPVIQAEYLTPSSLLKNRSDLTFLIKRNPTTLVFSETSAFIQDEWHPSRRFSLSAGIRWELDPPPTSEDGQPLYTIRGSVYQPTTLTLARSGTALWQTSHYNFAPRLGFAWMPYATEGNRVTVLRAGAGVFFDTDDQVAAMGVSGLGFLALSSLTNVALPITSAQLSFPISTSAPYTSANIFAFPEHLQLPYTLEWNASLQQELGRAQSFTLSYVASNGRRLLQTGLFNVQSQNPNFGNVYYPRARISSSYQSLQAQMQRTVARGLHAIVSYTWSHSLDFGSNSTLLPVTRGNSDFDVRTGFNGGVSWDLPHSLKGIAGLLANGWGTDARVSSRSSFPITLNGATKTDPSGQVYYTGVNLDSTQPVYLYSNSYAGGKVLNPTAFSIPGGLGVGNTPRNSIRGFGLGQFNVAVRREFELGSGLRLQFRAETFNILNHPNFGYINPTLTTAQFGQATKMLNQSLGTLSSQYQQGGPRSMQFALKVIF